jgi:hypothetical protein
MGMALRSRKGDFACWQDIHQFEEGEELIRETMENPHVKNPMLRAWVSPETAEKLAILAKSHGVPSTIMLGAVIRHGIANWPADIERRRNWDEEADHWDIEELIAQYDEKEGK